MKKNDKIIEILDNCMSRAHPCLNCPLAQVPVYDDETSCTRKLLAAALTVLKEQKKEIERLSKIIEL